MRGCRLIFTASFATVLIGWRASFAGAESIGKFEVAGIDGGFVAIGGAADAISDGDPNPLAAERAPLESAGETQSFASLAEPELRYGFYPISANLDRDVSIGNFVDVNRRSGLLAWDCTAHTYEQHAGHDVFIRGFGEQAIGVPILTALDGVVVNAHDGEFDMDVAGSGEGSGPANFVTIEDAASRIASYVHMKQWSVSVSIGQFVKAGEQIGMVGSSGISGWPHLHFETRDRGGASVFEPFAGPCRPGESGWIEQPSVPGDTAALDFAITPSGEVPNIPFDAERTGALLREFQSVAYWMLVRNLPAGIRDRVRFLRPDGTLAADSGIREFANPAIRFGAGAFATPVDLDALGTWQLVWEINGETILSAPFEVVGDPSEIANRPPRPIRAYLDPAEYTPEDVVFCRVQTDPLFDDPDYDIVHYAYEWLVDGETLRTATHAGQADAIPRNTIASADVLECRVTPSDGLERGETVSTACGERDPRCIRVAIEVVRPIQPGKRGVIPVVLYGGEDLDVDDLAVDSLRFGPNGVATAHDLGDATTWNEHTDDLNRDGFVDLMTHFRANGSGIAAGDVSADLVGWTLEGRPLRGRAPIRTLDR